MMIVNNPEKEQICPVFGVRSGIPLIGLGILLILFGILPFFFIPAAPLPVPITVLFTGFGLFLVWAGLTR